MPSANDLITGAFEACGIVGIGRQTPHALATAGLVRLNGLVGSLALDKLVVLRHARLTFTLVASAETRTIGPTGQFVATQRPVRIGRAAVIPVGQTHEVDVAVIRDWGIWAQLQKTETLGYPLELFYDPTATNGTLYFHPIPTTAATLVLYVPVPLSAFADLSTNYELADGYERMLRSNLAVELGAETKPPSDDVKRIAASSKADIQLHNVDQTEMVIPMGYPGTSGHWDITMGRHY